MAELPDFDPTDFDPTASQKETANASRGALLDAFLNSKELARESELVSAMKLAAHENNPRKKNAPPLTAVPDSELLPISKVCRQDLSTKLSSALTDNWAILPGASGFAFGALAGSVTKHLALNPAMELADRRFRIVRAGIIWGFSGLAANYLGGAAASFASASEKESLCLQAKQVEWLNSELQKQRGYLKELHEHLKERK